VLVAHLFRSKGWGVSWVVECFATLKVLDIWNLRCVGAVGDEIDEVGM
jgi:hypothetical protein